jgi:hypothetical protein
MRQVIPLSGGSVNSDVTFRVQLGDNLVEFRQNYRTVTGVWSLGANIEDITLFEGVILLPGSDLVSHWNIGDTFGQLVMVGDTPTIDNLGSANSLVWLSPDE